MNSSSKRQPQPKLATDKKQHMLVMFIITLGTGILTGSYWLAGALGIGIGLAKEIYDWQSGGVYSMEDMAANMVGITVAMLIMMMITKRKVKQDE